VTADKVKIGEKYTVVINSSLFKRFEVTDTLIPSQPMKDIRLEPILAMRFVYTYDSNPVGGLMVLLVHSNGTILYP